MSNTESERTYKGHPIKYLFVKRFGRNCFGILDRSRHANDPYQLRDGYFVCEAVANNELADIVAGNIVRP